MNRSKTLVEGSGNLRPELSSAHHARVLFAAIKSEIVVAWVVEIVTLSVDSRTPPLSHRNGRRMPPHCQSRAVLYLPDGIKGTPTGTEGYFRQLTEGATAGSFEGWEMSYSP